MDNQRKQYEKEYRQTLKYAAQDLAEKLIELPNFNKNGLVCINRLRENPEIAKLQIDII